MKTIDITMMPQATISIIELQVARSEKEDYQI